MARYRTAFCLLVAIGVQAGALTHARAYEEQASLDVELGYSLLLDSQSLPEHGATLDLGGAWGISDTALLRALLGYGSFADRNDVAHAGRLRVEAVYLLDVLQLVPFFGLGAALWVAERSADASYVRPGGHIVFGADYLLSRRWTLGVDIRSGILLERGEVLSTTDVAFRLSRMFETF
jgi:hypothetical protein